MKFHECTWTLKISLHVYSRSHSHQNSTVFLFSPQHHNLISISLSHPNPLSPATIPPFSFPNSSSLAAIACRRRHLMPSYAATAATLCHYLLLMPPPPPPEGKEKLRSWLSFVGFFISYGNGCFEKKNLWSCFCFFLFLIIMILHLRICDVVFDFQ